MLRFLAMCVAVFALVAIFKLDLEAQERRRVPPPAPKMQAPPQVVEGPLRDRLREKIALRIIKTKTIEKAMKDGVGGKKLTRQEAEAAYERMVADLGEDGIMTVAKEAAPPISGKLAGGPLTDFLDWLLANAPAILELIMKLLPLFL
jgi:hypothetical protein